MLRLRVDGGRGVRRGIGLFAGLVSLFLSVKVGVLFYLSEIVWCMCGVLWFFRVLRPVVGFAKLPIFPIRNMGGVCEIESVYSTKSPFKHLTDQWRNR